MNKVWRGENSYAKYDLLPCSISGAGLDEDCVRCLKQDVLATKQWLKGVNSEHRDGWKKWQTRGQVVKNCVQDEVALCQTLVYGTSFNSQMLSLVILGKCCLCQTQEVRWNPSLPALCTMILVFSCSNDTKDHLSQKASKTAFQAKEQICICWNGFHIFSEASTVQGKMTKCSWFWLTYQTGLINFILYLKYKHHNTVILVFFSTCFLVLTFQWVECP